MRMTTSFTGPRGVRYPSPDVARGFMLLFIALANVPSWNKMPNGAISPSTPFIMTHKIIRCATISTVLKI